MKLNLWRSVRRALAAEAFSGEGAARFPGRYNAPGVRAVYFADCPAGCGLELVASYAAPEALLTHVLFEVAIDAELVDLRGRAAQLRYNASLAGLTASDDYSVPRLVGAQLTAEGKAGAIVPAATVAEAFNVVIYPDLRHQFRVKRQVDLALDRRVLRRLGS